MVANLNVINSPNPDSAKGSPGFSPSSCSPSGACGNGLEKIYPTCAVRYGYMNYIGEFRYAPGMLFGCGAKVVIQTERGIEIGQQVSLTCTGCDKSVKRTTMLDYVKNSGNDFLRPKSGHIIRSATGQDLEEDKHIVREASQKLARARQIAVEQNLPMKFVTCEHLFGGERIIFHFMSESRVDFRDLVRDLAHEYHTRIEMHQVGARDEARLVADYEICGRECCCKNFLKTLRPVSMRMAKLQKATLDPSKVSGRCGRLRCCLRYEHEGYEDLNKKLARVGTRVQTDRGIGTVKDRQVLTQLLSIVYDTDNFVETVGSEFVTVFDRNNAPPPPERIPDARNDRGGPPPSRQGQGPQRPPREQPPRQNPPLQRPQPQPNSDLQPPRNEPNTDPGPRPADQSRPQFPNNQPSGRRRSRRGRRGRRDGGNPNNPNDRGSADSGPNPPNQP